MRPSRAGARAAVLILAVMIAGCRRAPARPVPEPPPGPPPPAPLINVPRLQVCVLQDGRLADVVTDYNPVTGDTLVGGRPFGEAFPPHAPGYAASASWMVLNEPIPFRGYTYIKYGRPRVYAVRAVERMGEYQGTVLFTEAGTGDRLPGILLVPVRPGCEFQTYQTSFEGNAVRG
jgi:hypothetical protein